jgi:hypothetical protein
VKPRSRGECSYSPVKEAEQCQRTYEAWTRVTGRGGRQESLSVHASCMQYYVISYTDGRIDPRLGRTSSCDDVRRPSIVELYVVPASC